MTCCGDRARVKNNRNKSQLMASILEGDYEMDDPAGTRLTIQNLA